MSAVYDVAYLGNVALSRSSVTSCLSSLQRPLLDLYVTFIPPPSSKSSRAVVRELPWRRLTLTDRGIIISVIESGRAGRAAHDSDAFYAMSAVMLWEPVRFAPVRAGNKYRGAFEPIGDHLTGAVEFISLDKHTVHLATMVEHHPVMLVCLMRRTTSNKYVDLHAFVCDSPQLALDATEDLRVLHHCYSTDTSVQDLQLASESRGNKNDLDQPQTGRPQRTQSQRHRPHREAASSVDCFVLTQDDVRGDVPQRKTSAPVEPAASVPGPSRPKPASVPGPSRSEPALVPGPARSEPTAIAALGRSSSTAKPPDVRPKSLLPVSNAADTADVSTWLDDPGQQSDDRPASRRVTDAQPQDADDGYEFHFGLTSSPSSSSLSSSSAPAAASSSRPVALVQPHKVTGVRVMPEEISSSLASWSLQNKSSSKPTVPLPTSDTAPPQDASRSTNRDRRPTPAASLRDQLKSTSSQVGAPRSTSQTALSTTAATSASLSASPPAAAATSDTPDPALLTSKDKEIASAVSNMKVGYQSSQSTLSAHGTNFEKCLGYFP